MSESMSTGRNMNFPPQSQSAPFTNAQAVVPDTNDAAYTAEGARRDLDAVRVACESIDDEGSIPSRPCHTFVDAQMRLLAYIESLEAATPTTDAQPCGPCPQRNTDDGCPDCEQHIIDLMESVVTTPTRDGFGRDTLGQHGTVIANATPTTDAGEPFRTDPPAVCDGCPNALRYCYMGVVSSWVFYAARMGECPMRDAVMIDRTAPAPTCDDGQTINEVSNNGAIESSPTTDAPTDDVREALDDLWRICDIPGQQDYPVFRNALATITAALAKAGYCQP